MRSGVIAGFKERLSKSQVDEVLAERGLGETARAEQLDVNEMLGLVEALRGKCGGSLPADDEGE